MTAGTLAVVLHEAASLRGFFPLSLVLPLPGSVTFLALVPLLEALLESLTLSIPRSFLVVALSAPAVGFAVALWLWPERALRRFFFASVSLIDPVALSPLLHRVFANGFRHWCTFHLCGGARVATRKKTSLFFSEKKRFFSRKKHSLKKNRSKFCFFHFQTFIHILMLPKLQKNG